MAAIRSIQGNPYQMAARHSGARTTADAMRVSKPRKRRGGTPEGLAADAAIAPLAPPEFGDGFLEMGLVEGGPQGVDEHQHGVGALPEQEVADALLAAGADQQVGIGHTGGQQFLLEQLLVDLLGGELAGRHLAREDASGAQNLVARAVVYADVDVDPGVAAGT